MTLITYQNSAGEGGRCDAKCYTAKHPECHCICGGANHGAGLSKAMDNTREMAEEWIRQWEEAHPGQGFAFEKNPQVNQLSLF